MQRLTGLDASFLYLERPAMHMHVAGVSVFAATAAHGDIYRQQDVFSWDATTYASDGLLPKCQARRRARVRGRETTNGVRIASSLHSRHEDSAVRGLRPAHNRVFGQ